MRPSTNLIERIVYTNLGYVSITPLTLTNTGAAPLKVYDIYFWAEPNWLNAWFDGFDGEFTLEPGESREIIIRGNPDSYLARGTLSRTDMELRIRCNDPDITISSALEVTSNHLSTVSVSLYANTTTPTPSPVPTESPTATASPEPTATLTATPTATAPPSASATPSASPSATATASATDSPAPTLTPLASPTPTPPHGDGVLDAADVLADASLAGVLLGKE